jgi:hypothetical protein
MKTKEKFKKGDIVSYINEDKDIIVSVKRKNKDGSFDEEEEETTTFFYSGMGKVEKVRCKYIEITEFSMVKGGFDRTITLPPSMVFATHTSVTECDKELKKLESLNNKKFKELKDKLKEKLLIFR